MSTQKGNIKRARPQKYQNKSAFKNVYHDTSKQTQRVVTTDVTGVCARCKDCIDWKIKYKKYKPLTQPKTCASCKQKAVKLAYHVYCTPCSSSSNKCAKCGDKKEIVLQPKLSAGEQASGDRELQFELEQLPERKRRTFLRLQEKGLLTGDSDTTTSCHGNSIGDEDSVDDDDDDDNIISDTDSLDCDKLNDREQSGTENQSGFSSSAAGIDSAASQIAEDTSNKNNITELEKLNVSGNN